MMEKWKREKTRIWPDKVRKERKKERVKINKGENDGKTEKRKKENLDD